MIKLVELLQNAKSKGFLYSNIPYPCGIDEAISYINASLVNDKGFKANQLITVNGDNLITHEIRKSPKHKKCFKLRLWR